MPTPENPIIEHQNEFKVPPELQSELKAVEVNPKTNIQTNSAGQPVISNQPAPSAKIQLPGDTKSLVQKAKGSITNAATWLAIFLLRALAIKNHADNQ